MRRTNIYLADEQCVALDRIAQAEGVSRAEVVRRLIDVGLTGSGDDLLADLAAIRESAGALANDLDAPPARGEDARSRYLDEMWQRDPAR